MEDVTEEVLAELNDAMSGRRKGGCCGPGYRKQLPKKAKGDTHYDVVVKEFFAGNEFYMFVYETFTDVRLVGAPPESIGKFGGDTDNWMWPRHTGDFSLFRVYSGPDGKPADYSENNIPLEPQTLSARFSTGCTGRRLCHGNGVPRQHRPLPYLLWGKAGPGPDQPNPR